MRRILGAAAASVVIALAAPALASKQPLGPSERIDLNRAGIAELMRLPGVGERRARAIVAHRAKRPFLRAEDVLAVKGLGPAWFARVKAHLSVGAAPPATAAAR